VRHGISTWTLLGTLILAAQSCERRPAEEQVRVAAAEFLEASRARDFEAVWPLLSSEWRHWTTEGLAGFPAEVAAAVDPECDDDERFLAACRAWLERTPPRSLCDVEEPPATPPWLLPADLLESLSADGVAVEPKELLVWSEEEFDTRKVQGLSVKLGIGRREFGAFLLDGAELSFLEEDGHWRFQESTVTLRTASEQSPGIRLAESVAGHSLVRYGTIVNVLTGGRIEVMDAPVALSELAGLVVEPADGPPVVAVDERVPWRRAATVLRRAAEVATTLELAAAFPREARPAADATSRELRPGRGITLIASPTLMIPLSFTNLWRAVTLTFPPRPLVAKEGVFDVVIELPPGEIAEPTIGRVREFLERLAAGDRVPRLVVDAHPDTPWRSVMAVLDAALAAEVWDYRLARPGEIGATEILVNGAPIEEIGEGKVPPLAPDHDALQRIIIVGGE
jgi:hypothetical protein